MISKGAWPPRLRVRPPRRLSVPRIVLGAVALALVARLFVVDLVVVRGDSMTPTIRPNSVAVLWRCAYGLRRPFSGRYLVRWSLPRAGDVVVVSAASEGARPAVKRVFEVGPAYILGGEGSLSARGGTVAALQGEGLEPAQRFIPGGRVFVIGDNEERSFDSRWYGAVPIETIQGKVILYRGGVPRRTSDAIDQGHDSRWH